LVVTGIFVWACLRFIDVWDGRPEGKGESRKDQDLIDLWGKRQDGKPEAGRNASGTPNTKLESDLDKADPRKVQDPEKDVPSGPS
jgi:hypothetical protein